MPSGRSILIFTSLLLGVLVMLLGIKASWQEAPESFVTAHTMITSSQGHHLSFHKFIARRKDAHHPEIPAKHKHHRGGGHRVPVAKISVPQACTLPAILTYRLAPVAPLARVYRYEFFREITPPPPKGC